MLLGIDRAHVVQLCRRWRLGLLLGRQLRRRNLRLRGLSCRWWAVQLLLVLSLLQLVLLLLRRQLAGLSRHDLAG